MTHSIRTGYHTWVLLFVACAVLSACGGGKKQTRRVLGVPQPRMETFIVIDTNAATPLPDAFLGFNVDVYSSPASYPNRDFQRAAERLRPGSAAYPGSALANYFDWKIGLAPDEWLAGTPEGSSATVDRLRVHSEFNSMKGGMQLHEFLEFCLAVGAAPLCTVNVHRQEPKDSSDWMRASQILGLPVGDWELGRNLWAKEYRKAIPGVEDYLRYARPHALALGAVGPSVRIAVGVPVAGLLAPEGEADEQRAWVDALAQEDFYDAVALRLSYSLWAELAKQPAASTFYEMAKHIESSTGPLFQACAKKFSGRGVWITELGVGFQETPELENTLLHALAVSDMILSASRYAPRLERILAGQLAERVGLSNALAAEAEVYRRFDKTGRIVEAGDIPLKFSPTPAPTYALAMLGEAFAKAQWSAPVEMHMPPYLTERGDAVMRGRDAEADRELPRAVVALALMNDDGEVTLALLNRSRTEVEARLVMNGRRLKRKIKGKVLGGMDLLECNAPPASGVSMGHEDVKPYKEKWESDELSLAPYSLTILEVGKP